MIMSIIKPLLLLLFLSLNIILAYIPSLPPRLPFRLHSSSSDEALDAIKNIELQKALGIEIGTSPPEPLTPLSKSPPLDVVPLPPPSLPRTLPPQTEASLLVPSRLDLPNSETSVLPTSVLPPLRKNRRSILPVLVLFVPLIFKLIAVLLVKCLMDVIVAPVMVVGRFFRNLFMGRIFRRKET
ncbi:hypothetical protein TrVE_jg13281 [Triparma verrucosa]|uniref:Transmembrane protein n=1 Tax=Triparma verrucosa TaxID=1606542 RepID=A0A9W7C7E6_9STRA|nr:hypothetical protein TrVE_jg13281 [Triparma verrucosa]